MTPDERAARARLGEWLAAEPGRTWDTYQPSERPSNIGIALYPSVFDELPSAGLVEGDGPTLADAIIAALDAVGGATDG